MIFNKLHTSYYTWTLNTLPSCSALCRSYSYVKRLNKAIRKGRLVTFKRENSCRSIYNFRCKFFKQRTWYLYASTRRVESSREQRERGKNQMPRCNKLCSDFWQNSFVRLDLNHQQNGKDTWVISLAGLGELVLKIKLFLKELTSGFKRHGNVQQVMIKMKLFFAKSGKQAAD